nr:mediator of DNA damage checkpoint protein 1 isoform X2 [Jaculus jaculus]
MEDTQVVDWDAEEEEETERSSNSLGYSLEPIGRLHIFGGTHGPQKDYPLYIGKNVIGRSPDCSVILPFPSISKLHAVIEIPSWNKAALLQDCGSLNGTRIMRPPKILTSGINYRLRNKDLILLADFPCQYYRLDIPLPLVSRGPLAIEETPRIQGGTQPSRILLAEDSEEEVDFLSERCVVNEPRITSSPLTTVVPESDEEGLSAAPGVPGPSFVTFDLVSDTDEEEGQLPKAEEASSATSEGAIVEAEQPDERTTGIQRVKAQATVQRYKDRKVKSDAGNDVVPLGVVGERSHLPRKDSDTDMDEEHQSPGKPAKAPLERAQPSGFVDSDTDVEEEGIPMTPAVVPVKKRQILRSVGKKGPRAPGLARLPERPSGRDTSVEEVKAPLAVPLERGQTSVVINSDMDDEEEVSAALALAHLKESGAILWSRDKAMEEDRAQPQISYGRNSDTNTEKEKLPGGKRETIPTDKDGILVTHSKKSQPPFGHSDSGEEADMSSPGIQLVGSQASTFLDNVDTKEDVLPGPSVLQIPAKETNQADVEAKLSPAMLPIVPLEEGVSSAVADVGKSQLPEAGDAGTHWVTAVLKQESTFEEAQDRSPVAQVEQVVVYAGSPREPTMPQREGAQTPMGWERKAYVGRTKNSEDCYDDPEDLNLPATQCFVKMERQSPEIQTLEDEPTQAFPLTLPQEPGPSHCSFQTPGALDVPWEILSTQPFCLREFEVSEPQPIATSLEAHGSCPSTSRALPRYEHPVHISLVHTEPLGTQGRETMEKDMGNLNCKIPPAENASKGDSESSNPSWLHTVPAASASPQNCLTSQSQKHSVPHSLVSPPSPSEPPIPIPHNGRLEASESLSSSEPSTRPLQYTVKPHTALPTDQPATSKPTSRATRGKTNRSSIRTPEPPVTAKPISLVTQGRTSRSSVKTPEPVVPTGPEFQPTSSDQPATPKLLSRVTRSKTSRSTVRTSEPVLPIGPELQLAIPRPVALATQGRISRSSVKTPKPVVPTGPELQPISSDQPATPKPISRVTRGRTSRSSVKDPEPIIQIDPELQPATPKPVSQATRGRTSRSSVKTPEVVIPTPELHLPTSIDRPVNPNHSISQVTRSRTNRSSVKTSEPVVSTGPEIQPPTYMDQPVTLEPMSQVTQGRAPKSSVTTPKPVISAIPEPQPLMSREEPVTPNPISRVTRSRTSKSSTKTPESGGRTPTDLDAPASTNQSVISEAIDQSKTLRSSTHSATPISIIPKLQPPVATAQPAPLEPSNSRRKRAAGKQGSHIAPIGHRPSSATPEPELSSTNQRSGVLRAAESLGTIPEPAFHQIAEAHTHAPLTQNVEEAGRSGFTLEPKPEASQIRKRPSTTMDSSLLQKRPRRGMSQKTVFSSEEEDSANRLVKEEGVVVPEPDKRRKDQTEEGPKANASRILRRNKPNEEPVAPRVLFTGVVDARGERAVLALGGSLATSVNEASHLVTDRIRRTVKFLCALGKGIPILSLDWLYQSRKAGCFLPPDEYLVADPEQENNFGFSLRDALSRARERKLLEDYEIHVTAGVQPPPPQMGEIITCCGGTVLPSMPRSYKAHRVVVTCPQDIPRCSIPSRLGLPLVSPEFLLTGVLKQEATPEAFLLSNLQMSST